MAGVRPIADTIRTDKAYSLAWRKDMPLSDDARDNQGLAGERQLIGCFEIVDRIDPPLERRLLT